MGDLPKRIDAIEAAIALLAANAPDGCYCQTGSDVGSDGQGATDAFGMTAAKPTSMTASKTKSELGGEGDATDGISLGTTIKPLSTDEETAETLRAMNAANMEYYKLGQNVTSGSQSTAAPGEKGQANSGGFLPNAAGTLRDQTSSTTASTLDPGKTWGTDRASIRRGNQYQRETARANRVIDSINQRNAAFWRKA
jgi:hypothetical protein